MHKNLGVLNFGATTSKLNAVPLHGLDNKHCSIPKQSVSNSGEYILRVSFKRQPFEVANFPLLHTQVCILHTFYTAYVFPLILYKEILFLGC